jgi:hypothetical protein
MHLLAKNRGRRRKPLGVALDITPDKIVNIFAEILGLPAGKYGYFLDG